MAWLSRTCSRWICHITQVGRRLCLEYRCHGPPVTSRNSVLFCCFWLPIGDINIFHASSFHIILQTTFGLQIQIQHVPLMQMYVSLEQSYRTKTRGMCQVTTDVFNIDQPDKYGPAPCTDKTFGSFRIVWELQHDHVWWHDHSSGHRGRDSSNLL